MEKQFDVARTVMAGPQPLPAQQGSCPLPPSSSNECGVSVYAGSLDFFTSLLSLKSVPPHSPLSVKIYYSLLRFKLHVLYQSLLLEA